MKSASRSGVEFAHAIRSKPPKDGTLTWFRGASPTPRYVGVGRPWSLYRHLEYLSGWRGAMERAAMRLVTPVMRGPAVTEPKLLLAWDALLRLTGSATEALLLYTEYYKGTIFVGPVLAGQPLFVKVYSREGDAGAEARRRERIHDRAANFFRVPRLERAEEAVLCYELVPHGRRRPSLRTIASSALAFGRSALLASTGTVPLRQLIDLNRLSGLAAAASLPVIGRVVAVVTAIDDLIPVAEAHGDLTPWNVFSDIDGRICLVDYERVLDASPFFDIFHVVTQPRSLAGNASLPTQTLGWVVEAAGVEKETAAYWFIAYLLFQLATDLAELVEEGRQHHQLRTLITTKTRLLIQAVAWLGLDGV